MEYGHTPENEENETMQHGSINEIVNKDQIYDTLGKWILTVLNRRNHPNATELSILPEMLKIYISRLKS